MANNLFHHEEIYRGKDALAKLASFHITVCGAGAIGSNLTDNLARQGFKSLRVIDDDTIERHNVGTQLFWDGDSGAKKVTVLNNRVFKTVGVEIEPIMKRLEAGSVKSLLKNTNLVIDTFDNTVSRQLVKDHCQASKIECLHAGLFEDYGEVIWNERYVVPQMTEGIDVCDYPLARNLIMLVVAVTTEHTLDFVLNKTKKSSSITLRDLSIKPIKF